MAERRAEGQADEWGWAVGPGMPLREALHGMDFVTFRAWHLCPMHAVDAC